jgi:hypothetical protein
VIRPRWLGGALDAGLLTKNEAIHYESNNRLSISNDHEMAEMKNNQKSLQQADANLGDEASESENVSDLWA